jgi:hypothetical protein
MKYVSVPSELHITEIRAGDTCFSPGKYVRFIPPKSSASTKFESLDKLVILRDSQIQAVKGDTYLYAEIGDIDISTGGVRFREMLGYKLPTQRPSVAKVNDVLVSTVRTYRKGIGLVTDRASNLVTTNAFLNICGVSDYVPGLTLQYLYSFLRSDFFVEQVWSMVNRGLYPRMDKGALDKILIPISSSNQVIQYISALVHAIMDKEKLIRKRHAQIINLIDTELSNKQTGKKFIYSHPNLEEIKSTSRLDTGLYCVGFRSFKHRVENYAHGMTYLSKMGVQSRRGPNLAVSVIGKSLYSREPRKDWYQLIRPVNISVYGTLSTREWLGTPQKLPTVTAGDIVLGCEGFEKGRSLVLIDPIDRCTTNFHGTFLYWPGAELWQIVFVRCFLAYLREQGVVDWVGVGGSGGHMSPEYFDYLPFPKFPENVQLTIAKLYHNPSPAPKEKAKLTDFLDWHRRWNEGLGIWELDREMKTLQAKLEHVQSLIIDGKSIRIDLH